MPLCLPCWMKRISRSVSGSNKPTNPSNTTNINVKPEPKPTEIEKFNRFIRNKTKQK